MLLSLVNFSARMDRYNHDIGEDTDDTDDSPLFGSFSSCSPQYRKVQTRLGMFEDLEESSGRKSFSRGDSGQSDHSESSPSNLGSTVDTPETDGVRELTDFPKKIANPTTPESSQTESDDVSPQIQRKRRLHNKDSLPRFSISIEDNRARYVSELKLCIVLLTSGHCLMCVVLQLGSGAAAGGGEVS
jgi:hypothetical protein